ncbi:MAG: AAA family ATPase, partial [Actinomycetia bacterium]|nr:AAA family ATPase [Actinomycetes bacterium]
MDTPGTYRPRVVDVAIDALLRTMGAVLIEGPKWCGKTWTGLRHARSVVWVADPADNYLTRRIAHSDPASLLNGDKPLLLDEWQDAPGLWDAVRSSVDASGGAAGHYLLTGSATPRDTATSHSGTGRIARVRMWPMSLWESGLSDGSVSLGELLDGQPPRVARGSMTEAAMIEAILVGGWPGSLARPAADVLGVPRAYLESVAASDASRLDGARRDP